MTEKWRIIWTDNFCRSGEKPGVDEYFIDPEEFFESEEEARDAARELNKREDEESPNYYRAVKENYKLKVFEP